MKRMMITAAIALMAGSYANAQTTGSTSSNSTTNSSEGSVKQKKKTKQPKKVKLDHRRNYKWKSGQQATPTGQEATGTGSGYSAIKKDTSGKRDTSGRRED